MTETHVKGIDSVASKVMCPYHLGFLSQRPKGFEIPDECLTCERIFDCMARKHEEDVVKTEEIPESQAIERKDFPEGRKKSERLGEDEVEQDEASRLTKPASNNDFTIKSPGMLYAHWSSTVLIRKETLCNWGNVKEVDIEIAKGKKISCKVYPIDDLEIGVLQVPDKMQLRLGVKKGGIVKVKPSIKA